MLWSKNKVSRGVDIGMLQEIVAGIVSALVVSPVMTIIDKSIIKSQFLKEPLRKSMMDTTVKLFQGSLPWNPALNIMTGVYASTYLTANITHTVCKNANIDYKIPTAVCTSAVNIVAIAYKDIAYAKLFAQKRAVFPKSSYGLFALRDGMTITSSFVLKHDVTRFLEKWGLSHHQADLFSSFSVPMAAQLISTPLHILSLDLYDRPNEPMKSRLANIRQCYKSVCFGRMFRIIPAFGLGGYINDVLVTSKI